MVKDSSNYVKDVSSVRRSTACLVDKSWDGNGQDVQEILSRVNEKDQYVGIILELCWAFGLRMLEAIKFRPNVEHVLEKMIAVRDGTKGDRPRTIPIEEDIQIDVLIRAKAMTDEKTDHLGKRNKTLEQKRRRVYTVLESLKITLHDNSISTHGLRHQYMQHSYKRLTGRDAPVKGGNSNGLDKKVYRVITQQLMERAGHTRTSIGTAYYGSERTKKQPIEKK